MGGDVGVDSEAGQGSCFWFRIRADLLAAGADSRDEVRRAIVGAGDTAMGVRPATFTGHILVVDDNPTNRLVLKAMLNKPGVRCDFVEDGQQAVEAIRSHDADPSLGSGTGPAQTAHRGADRERLRGRSPALP